MDFLVELLDADGKVMVQDDKFLGYSLPSLLLLLARRATLRPELSECRGLNVRELPPQVIEP